MKKISILPLLFLLCLGWLQAQTYNVTVSGQVTDISNGNPVANHPVDVNVDSSFFGFSYFNTVTTDVNGNYSDVIVVPGNVSTGVGYVGTRDCTPSAYHTANFTFSGPATIPNLNFQICTTTSGSCSAMFSANHVPGTTLVNFSDMSSSSGTITSWAWTFGDGNTSTLQNPQHAYNSMGPYTVCLTITDNSGCTDTYCDSLYLGGSGVFCSATLNATPNPSGVVSFSATGTGSGSPILYTFDFGDGSPIVSSGSPNVTHTYTANGTYTACVFVDFTDSCRATSCASVTITGTSGCQAYYTWAPDSSGQFSIIVTNWATGTNLSYLWTFGDGTSSTQAYPTHQYSGPGTYVVCLTVTSNSPSCTDTYCDSIVVINKINAPFTINIVAGGATAVAPQQQLGFNASFSPNPANDFVQVELDLENAAATTIDWMDLSGRTIASEQMGELATGQHLLRLNTNHLPAGLYLARIKVGDRSLTKKLVITH